MRLQINTQSRPFLLHSTDSLFTHNFRPIHAHTDRPAMLLRPWPHPTAHGNNLRTLPGGDPRSPHEARRSGRSCAAIQKRLGREGQRPLGPKIFTGQRKWGRDEIGGRAVRSRSAGRKTRKGSLGRRDDRGPESGRENQRGEGGRRGKSEVTVSGGGKDKGSRAGTGEEGHIPGGGTSREKKGGGTSPSGQGGRKARRRSAA